MTNTAAAVLFVLAGILASWKVWASLNRAFGLFIIVRGELERERDDTTTSNSQKDED